ncbi:MAG: OmpA family protein [Oligoflexales bacterium]|nr:OmpA family protein [Oligoflexales bacterium]
MRGRRRQLSTDETWLISYADLITNLLIYFALIIAASTVQVGRLEKISQALNQDATDSDHSLTTAEKKIQEALVEHQLDHDVRVKLTNDGLELSFSSGAIFDSASDIIIPSMESSLAKIMDVLKPYANSHHIAIEGHTDERPINSSRFKSNWELASARAMTIREKVEARGIDKKLIRVESYADNKPLPQEDLENMSKDEILARHRRVIIRLY